MVTPTKTTVLGILFLLCSVFTTTLHAHRTVSPNEAPASLLIDSIFVELPSSIPSYSFSSISIGDYDNDGDQDIAIGGALDGDNDTFADSSAVDIYQNIDGVFTRLATDVFYGLHAGTVKWIDIDLDGDLDLLTCGQNYVDIFDYRLYVYRNNDGEFEESQLLSGAIFSSMNTGDYDLDGDLDLLLSGAIQSTGGASVVTRIYNNNAGILEDSGISLPGVQNGDAQFTDFNQDGFLDVLLMGTDDVGNYLLHYYQQTSTGFTLAQEMDGMYLGGMAIADYDNDGDQDFAIMGDDLNDDYAAFLYTFAGLQFGDPDTLVGIDNSSGYSPIDWGDYDNDGRRDLVMSGNDFDFEDRTFLYQNTEQGLMMVSEGLRDLGGNTALGFADFDGDNDLDIVISGSFFTDDFDYLATVIVHENTVEVLNAPPTAPATIVAEFNTSLDTVNFEWAAGTDDTTPAAGLYYWLQVNRSSDGQLVADYPVYGTSWAIQLPADEYDWNVRSVDAADVFSLPQSGLVTVTSVETVTALKSWDVFPNPTQNWLSLAGDVSDILQIELFNSAGQLVRRERLFDRDVQVAHLPSGQYRLRILTRSGDQYFTTFVKN